MSREVTRRYILAVFVLAFVVRVAYAFVTPPFQAPDEYSHYSYVKFLHTFRELPVQPNPAAHPEELEFHQPPLYYVLAATLFPSTKLVEARPLLPMRFMNILLSMLTIGIVYYFASSVFRENPFVAALICTTVALLPTYSYLSATMRNGTLATLFASLGFHLCAKAVLDEKEQHQARWSWIGAVAGLAMLSKLSSIAFAAAALLLLLATSRDWRVSIHRAGWFVLGVTSTAGWWFLRNWIVYGHWLKIIENGDQYVPAPLSWADEKRSAIVIFKTFWAVFGRINEFHYADIYRLCWLLSGLAVLGIARYWIQGRRDIPRRLALFFAVAIALSAMTTLYYAHNYNSDQGRYMYPALIPIMTFLSLGLSALFPVRYHRMVLDSVLFAFAGVNVLVLARLAQIYWPIG
jgi:hypothetical protein